jgi:uncharacterized protein YggT (Ycf19 family)
MTYDQRPPAPPDPVEPVEPTDDGTRVVERETYVERPVDPAYAPPPASSNVNVSNTGGYVATGPGPLYWARRVLSLLFGILAILLVLRIVLLLLVANPGNQIVDFIYSVTEPFVAPFRGMFQFDVVVSGERAFDVAAVVALIGWALIYALIMAILRLADRATR